MQDKSDDDIFFDAIGDENQMKVIQEQIKEASMMETQSKLEISKHGSSTGESPDRTLQEIHNKIQAKLEDNSDVSRSIESTGITKNINQNPIQMSSNLSSKNKFFAMLGKKPIEAEFSRESIKQNNMNHSNFGNLICLQFIDDDKKQENETFAASKKDKAASSTWIAKFSPNDKFLATGGSDGILRVYKINIMDSDNHNSSFAGIDPDFQVMDPNCYRYVGHKFDIIDLSWFKDSKLLLTSSVDKTVILWNVESKELVKIFEHSDIVSCISFHPFVDEFFASGCFDKIIRIWDINETKVVDWVQTNDLITAITFSPDKNHLLVGFFKGTIKIYRTDQGKLKFAMEITCKNAFSWGKVNKVGKKVTAILFTEEDEFLVMTNDSRMRLIDFKNYETKVKYKGHSSGKYHIQPSYNALKELILLGSEDGRVYVWNKTTDYVSQINPIQKKNRNTSYESFKPFSKANTTCSVWLPFPALKKYKEKVLSIWKDIYVDNLMILFSSDGKIKVLGNLIELEAEQPSERRFS